MGVKFRPIGLPGNNYSQDEESQFRRNLETYLLEISSAVNSAESASEGAASPASKRESLLVGPYGSGFPITPGPFSKPVAVVDLTPNSIRYTGDRLLFVSDADATDLDFIIGGVPGDVVTVMASGNSNTVTLTENGGGVPNALKLTTSTVALDSIYDNVTFIRTGTFWIETARALH
tara:strand:+ start:44 stop:571 length:528 start_codon:yes stop_codon:yes gene_type:complete